MSDLRDLYQEVIIDHNRRPRNFGPLDDANRDAEGFNPLCGDEVRIRMRVSADGVIEEVRFEGHGCAISTASASILTDLLKGRTEAEVRAYFDYFHALVTGAGDGAGETALDTGKLDVLGGVGAYPARVKCATLPWHTAMAALQQRETPVTTEQ
jgi:nitrogen fixation NifU-like protein